jgi:hypothetical protein
LELDSDRFEVIVYRRVGQGSGSAFIKTPVVPRETVAHPNKGLRVKRRSSCEFSPSFVVASYATALRGLSLTVYSVIPAASIEVMDLTSSNATLVDTTLKKDNRSGGWGLMSSHAAIDTLLQHRQTYPNGVVPPFILALTPCVLPGKGSCCRVSVE